MRLRETLTDITAVIVKVLKPVSFAIPQLCRSLMTSDTNQLQYQSNELMKAIKCDRKIANIWIFSGLPY